MNSEDAHNELMIASKGYRDFYWKLSYDDCLTKFEFKEVKSFALWLLIGTKIERFATWDETQFSLQWNFYGSRNRKRL